MTAALADMLRRHERRLALTAAFVLLVGSAVVHGLWTDRWSSGRDLEAALNRLDAIPLVAPHWRGRVQELDDEQAQTAARVGITKIARRVFADESEQRVTALLMCGRFGPLSVHTPDVCYGAAGYAMYGRAERVEVKPEEGKAATMWVATFHRPRSPESPPLRVIWGWNAGQGWLAPGNPRWTFRMKPVLHKLYVTREMTSLDEPLSQEPCLALLRAWLPELDRTLFE
jgi:hypothetical protein